MRVLYVVLIAVALAAPAYGQEPGSHAVVFDSYMTPAAGAQSLLAAQHLIAAVEDRWLPLKLGDEQRRHRLALGILYRSGKFFALDMPQDHFILVAAHEVFGHGARFRELGDGRLRYGFDAPIPYGSGDAFTKFNGSFPISPLADLNVSAAGMEAQHALADAIAERAVARGRIHYREAWLYFESRLTAMGYILSASPHSADGHDPADYLDAFEHACVAPCVPSTRNQIQRRSLLTLADPLLYYSIYGLAVSYIGGGNTTGPMPLIPIGGGMRVMPSVGYALAPYGGEWIVRTAIKPGPGVTSVTLRVGNTGASSTFAVGARADMLRLRGQRIVLSLDVWRQPGLLADRTSDEQHAGAAAIATVVVPLPRALRSRFVEGIHIAAGYKSQGFVPGEQLSGGGLFRAGITLR